MNRIAWDFRTDPKGAVNFVSFDESNVFSSPDQGIMVMPGDYKVSLSKFEDGVFTQLFPPQLFKIEALNMASMGATDKKALYSFGKKVLELYRAVDGTNAYITESQNKLKHMKEAALQTPSLDVSVMKELLSIEKRLNEVSLKLNGDVALAKREFEAPTSINSRIRAIMGGVISTTVAPTNTFLNSYNDASRQFAPLLTETKSVSDEIIKLENLLEQNNAPYTPGRFPVWKQQ